MEPMEVIPPAVQRIITHTFNAEYTETSNYHPKPNSTGFAFELPNNGTMIEEKGDFAKCLIIGRLTCLDQFRTEAWVQKVHIFEIAGTVHSCRHMWKMIGVFTNLAEWRIQIHGQYSPSELKLTQTEELEFNSSVTHIRIYADWGTFKNKKPEYQRGIVSLVQFSLKIAAKCTKLTTFHIEVPDDDGHCLYFAVGDFILKSEFHTPIIVLKKLGKILCIQPQVDPTTLARNPAPQPSFFPLQNDRNIMATTPPAPGLAQLPTNTPRLHQDWNAMAPPNKRRKPQ